MCDINPRDIETWNTKSSSHTGGGGSQGNNGSDPTQPSDPGNKGDGGSGNGTTPPDPLWGIGGLSVDEETSGE